MKRWTLFTALVVVAVLLTGATTLFRARSQESRRRQFGSGEERPQRNLPEDAIPSTYLNNQSTHKLILREDETEVYRQLAARGAIREEYDYGSFRMVIVDETAAGGRNALAAMPVAPRDDQNMLMLNGYVLDTSSAQPLSRELPAELRQTRMAQARAGRFAPDQGLYIVQFVGPIQDRWLNELQATGADLVSYVPNNAYIVRTDRRSAALLAQMKDQSSHVQWVGDYEPAFRMSPELRAMRETGDTEYVRVVVQVLDGAEGDRMASGLRQGARQFETQRRVMKYRNVTVTVPVSQLAELAASDGVFAIEPAWELTRLDEAQGQIVAGNLAGNAPSGPGYLSWLAGRGFNSSQFGSFAVNVVDDAYSLTGHPDLATTRIPFQNNPTGQSGAQGGHGFLNSHIVGGFNSGTGTANEDANGYNYGLGIAPWARVGVTAIFGGTGASSTAWEGAAYGQGSRISSNSWGQLDSLRRPIARYNTTAQEYDAIVRDAQTATTGNQQLTIVFAAGNSGSTANTVSAPGTAKNVITVGASENVRQTGSDGCGIANSGADSANDIISFSSRGPVNAAGGDGRVKPDLVAPGTHIQAGIPQSNYNGSSVCNQYFPAGQTLYGWSSGTSHSTPAVAGGSALVYQAFLNRGFSTPSPAMVKAFLMNSAAYMSGTGAGGNLPSNSQGMGRMDLGRAFDDAPRLLTDQTQLLTATGQTWQVTGTVASSAQPVRVTLAWTDAPGSTTGGPWVNNLDLEVSVNGVTYLGNVFSGATSVSGGSADARNNVESVFLPAGLTGNVTVTVRATNIAGDGVPGNGDGSDQDFALVIYNAGAGAPPTSPTIGVSPANLSFAATAGGANPANQTISIANTGAGTLNWTASDNAAWLTLAPTSGTAPSTLTASVNISGLAAGTYNGAITLTGTGATNTPVTIPVTLTVAAASGTERIANGGFEGSVSPWVLSGAAWTNTGAYPRSGTGYIFFGGVLNSSHTAYQQISIPAGTAPNLTFWLNVSSNETTRTTQFDRIFVEVRNTSGALLATLASFSNLNRAAAGAYTQRGAYNLASFAGQTVRIQFRATNNTSRTTTFRIDDVSVK
ncbi:MAG: S8 family serine peptidase [Blastocatellia bacterium]|nr:S8 family serine peptidase [Blastocatellia bacterium]